ncbi:MAG: radical SAM family heme chaperone HemW [Candidatus Omnitrophica bacterium]|nr:radical SAM family heme chaperone HemW [Candidatus Omnitrophota bacterium]
MPLLKIPLYLHIPFCRKKCAYCDFYSVEYSQSLAQSYIKVLINQIEYFKKEYLFSTVYIGGGTPSVLTEDLLAKLLKSLDLKPTQEVSLEANPESLAERKLKLLLDLGINRLSIGVQSFEDKVLRFLQRAHNSQQAVKAIELAQKKGFKNINIDLIYAVPNKDFKLWKKELKLAVSLPITHISLYSLSYEEGTPLFLKLKNKEFTPLNSEEEAEMYKYALDFLEKKGFYQYEVSNFSKRGYECRHNLSYWANSSYLGLGPSAVSYIKGVRKKYIDDVYEYIAKVRPERGVFAGEESLNPLQKAKETAVLNIRRRKGIDFAEFKKATGFDFLEIEDRAFLEELLKRKLVALKRKNSQVYGLRLTKKGFLLADYVARELL